MLFPLTVFVGTNTIGVVMAQSPPKDARNKAQSLLLEQQAYLEVLKTADHLTRGTAALLKEAGLSPTQYNVLRILRGAAPEGLSCSEVGERMLTRDPDVTRLLDRMETRRLLVRSRGEKDRRVVTIHITTEGLELLKELDDPIQQLHKASLGHMESGELRALIALLRAARKAE
jgi:DNA-binding MarR family transcriptional regulator